MTTFDASQHASRICGNDGTGKSDLEALNFKSGSWHPRHRPADRDIHQDVKALFAEVVNDVMAGPDADAHIKKPLTPKEQA